MDAQDQFNARYVWTISTVAALGGLLFGYDWVVIGGAKPFYEAYFGLTTEQLIGWANSCALLGCLIGSLISGAISDRLGRKKLLLLAAFLFAVSSIFTGWASVFSGFVTWRIIGGVAIGIASNVSPTYIAEVSPAPWRGRLVALNQVTLVIGILIAQIVNWLIAQHVPNHATSAMIRSSWNGQYGWRWMFTAVAVPAVIFFVCAWFVPESPRWLVKNRRRAAAERVLMRIGGAGYAAAAL
ncbi:MAG: MFS transporter, partial [Bryobacteraceae bacterium]